MELTEIKNISKVRITHAKESLSAAQELLKLNMYKDSANRSYYAIFHAMRAVLIFDKIDMKSHKGVISEFRRLYIKTGIFSKKISDTITTLFTIRTNSDYEDFYVISKKDIKQQMKNAEFFIKEIEKYLKSKNDCYLIKK